jgi:hypothetical protein
MVCVRLVMSMRLWSVCHVANMTDEAYVCNIYGEMSCKTH